jgi:O-antigen/teichoic acid export membrane protein
MQIGKLTAVEVGSRTWGVAITIVLALMFESVWVLVAGGLLGALSKLVVTHSIAESPRHRFRWDPAASGSIYRFGRWILASTPFAYVINHGDRMILGGFLTMEELGYFAIGSLLAKAVVETSNTISTRVLFPLYSQIGRHTDDTLRRRVAMIRLMLMGLFLPPLWLLTVWGDGVVRLLYDARYEDAGWIAQITAAGMILPIIGRVGPVYMARGETWVNFVMAAVPCVGLALGVVVGYFVGGKVGVLIAIAASRSIQYPLQVWIAIRFGLWMPLYDLLGIATTLAVVGGGLLLLHA